MNSFKEVILNVENAFLKGYAFTRVESPIGDLVVERNGSKSICHPFHPATVVYWNDAPGTRGVHFYAKDEIKPAFYIDVDWFAGDQGERLNHLALINGLVIAVFMAMGIDINDNVNDIAAIDAAAKAFVAAYDDASDYRLMSIMAEYCQCYLSFFARHRKEVRALVIEHIAMRAAHADRLYATAMEEVHKLTEEEFIDDFCKTIYGIAVTLFDIRLDEMENVNQGIQDFADVSSSNDNVVRIDDIIDLDKEEEHLLTPVVSKESKEG